MALYAITTWNSGFKDNPNDVLAALEAQMETIDDAKTMYVQKVEGVGAKWIAMLVYET